mgnify:CR=1 FL=1
MLDKIIQFSIKNKFVILLFTLVLVAWGSYSIKQLPLDALPDVTNNQVQIITNAPTLASQEIEQLITYPLEQSLKTIPKVIELRSISRFGLSVVTVVFKDDAKSFDVRKFEIPTYYLDKNLLLNFNGNKYTLTDAKTEQVVFSAATNQESQHTSEYGTWKIALYTQDQFKNTYNIEPQYSLPYKTKYFLTNISFFGRFSIFLFGSNFFCHTLY